MKDAYYFSHDSNARNDQKCLKLRRVLGMEGYGIYWVLIEMLREASGFRLPLSSVPDIAYETRVSEEKVNAVITQFDLFEIHEEVFFSLRLTRSMELMQSKGDKYRKNALKRWKNEENAIALQLHCNGNALNEKKVKESKVKESKESNILNVFQTDKQAYDEITSDEQFIEQLERIVTHNTGFKGNGRQHVKNAIARFLLTESAKPDFTLRDKQDIRSHLVYWISKNSSIVIEAK